MRVPHPLALACSDSGGVADMMAIRENFICEIHKCQPFAKIFFCEINPLYSTCMYTTLHHFLAISLDEQRSIIGLTLLIYPIHIHAYMYIHTYIHSPATRPLSAFLSFTVRNLGGWAGNKTVHAVASFQSLGGLGIRLYMQ